MIRSHARWRMLAAAATAGLLLSGCSGAASTSDDPAGTAAEFELTAATPTAAGPIDEVTWALATEPFSLSPAYAFDYPDNTVLSNMCESLLRWNADLTTSPGLATEVTNPDPTTWVYTIREGVKFHDGSGLTAADVVASLKFHLDPAVGSYWQGSFVGVESIEQTGDFEVTVKTENPTPMFNSMMATAAGAVSSAASLGAGSDYGNQSTGVNCTGPFQYGSWATGESITLTKFADYWDADGAAHADTLKFVVMNDGNARSSALQTGEVDGGWNVPVSSIDTLRAATNGGLYFGVNTTTDSLIISNMEGPLGDERVRQALSMALNRDALVQAAAKGYAEPSGTLTTRSVWVGASEEILDEAFAENPYAAYDLEAAKALIAEAGAEGAELTMATMGAIPSFSVISQAVVSAGAEIGLKITLDERPANAYTMLFADPAAREGVDLFPTTWYLSSANPMEQYGLLSTGQFSNYGNWSNAEFDDITAEAMRTMDPEPHFAAAAQAQQIANEQLPWIPLYAAPTTVWMGERITGVEPSINYVYAPWAAKIGAVD